MNCVIVGARPVSAALIEKYSKDSDCLICADGGAEHVLGADFTPNVIIGDEDSAQYHNAPENCEIHRLPREKDKTDLHACIDHALELGAESITILGCTGGRLDHFLASLFLLEHIHLSGARGLIADDCNEIRLHMGGSLVIENVGSDVYLSLLPVDRSVSGITLTGLKYPLEGETLSRRYPIGVSNCAVVSGSVGIKSDIGRMLVIISRDKTEP